MAETRTIARPYAEAAFELAQEHDDLENWSNMLGVSATIAGHPKLRSLIGDPRVGQDQLIDTILGIAGEYLDEHGANFIRLLVENDRVSYLPEISNLFDTYRREAEQIVEAHVLSAFALSDEQGQQISMALEARVGHSVTMTQSVDESLIGGIMIRIGDRVIDGSIIGRLDQLTNALTR